MQTLDAAVVRALTLTERLRLETRREFFNALNQVNYDVPNRFVNTAGFGTVTGAMSPGGQIPVERAALVLTMWMNLAREKRQ